MSVNLYNRSLLSLVNHTAKEINYLVQLSARLKSAKKAGKEKKYLEGKNIALIFEKTSTRTRCAFEVATYDQGGNVTFIDSASSQLGHKESVVDTAKVLGSMYDAIEYRGFGQEIVETLSENAGVPVFNGLTDEFHPTQMIADLLTMQENSTKPLKDISFAYLGDARNNMGTSLLLVASKLGMDFRIACPKELAPKEDIMQICNQFAKESGAKITITTDKLRAVDNVDFIHTDVWVSMGEPVNSWKNRINLLLDYQVNMSLVKASNNENIKFMHCLPAFHNTQTKVGKEIAQKYPNLKKGIEVTNEVFESDFNIAFEQAENRMHTIKAIMVASLSKIQ